MADAQLAGNVARPDAVVGELDDPLPHQVRQGAPIHENSTQLVNSTVTYRGQHQEKESAKINKPRQRQRGSGNGEESSISNSSTQLGGVCINFLVN